MPWALVTTIDVIGDPKGQPRPRAFAMKANGGGRPLVRVYDPGTAEAWKSAIAEAVARARVPAVLEGPVRVDIRFRFRRPKRLLRKCDPVGEIWHVSKPDRDNLDKAVLDALTMLGCLRDDAQVCRGLVSKVYVAKGGQAGATILVWRWEEGGEP